MLWVTIMIIIFNLGIQSTNASNMAYITLGSGNTITYKTKVSALENFTGLLKGQIIKQELKYIVIRAIVRVC